jgi:hypothetical protein
MRLFGRTKELEVEITEYLDLVNTAVLIFKRDLTRYIKKDFEEFANNFAEIKAVENQADDYQKDIKYKLYKYMLIPEARGDVLSLLESIDNLVDLSKKVIFQLSIENPNIPKSVEKLFVELTDKSASAADELVKAMRSYFEDISMVDNYINKVHFYEHESDKIEENLKRYVFQMDELELCRKVHLRHFAEKIASLSDVAETISEQISVAAIKRNI